MGYDYTYSIFVSEAKLDNVCLTGSDLKRMFSLKVMSNILSASNSPMLLKRAFDYLFG